MKKINQRNGQVKNMSYSHNAMSRVPSRATFSGKYRAPEVSDHNQRQFHEQEPGVSFERARREAIEANQRGEWQQPF